MKTIIQNGIVVTMDQQMQVWDHGYVIIDGTKIVEAGPESELELKKAALARVGENWQEKDARRGIIMPGMVNTHSHLGMIPFRGLGDDCKTACGYFCFLWSLRQWMPNWQQHLPDTVSVNCFFPV